ncbi:DUF4186 domain-containing protein [Gluconacetobacter asukensis]|uniref:DUF4186 domain-containing protein n=1 Tax=Gluconacetobacter asukensis TaxID=1017181 RepID=A0A7W4J1L3_9PROT|nr:DUF4186 domain-containing protein [Gluconacetobacter asukensis]MBB2173030.1 DUF4186 domain-containing protein [Gluconacetobacter asukensis]
MTGPGDTGADDAPPPPIPDALWQALARSAFRARFHLDAKDRAYLEDRGLATIMEHAADFIARRLAPAKPARDGRQTPWRGHPVFVAQHATATCCRGCLEKWHGFAKGQALDSTGRAYVLTVIRTWLERERP